MLTTAQEHSLWRLNSFQFENKVLYKIKIDEDTLFSVGNLLGETSKYTFNRKCIL